jgi:hypothetical protein
LLATNLTFEEGKNINDGKTSWRGAKAATTFGPGLECQIERLSSVVFFGLFPEHACEQSAPLIKAVWCSLSPGKRLKENR